MNIKKFASLSLCITILLSSASLVYGNDVSYEVDRSGKTKQTDDVVYAHEQEDFNEQEYSNTIINTRMSSVLNGDSEVDKDLHASQFDDNNELTEEKLSILEGDTYDVESLSSNGLSRINGIYDEYMTLSVTPFEQINDHYCGPATTKQVFHFIERWSFSQSEYARKLGTTGAGTVMPNIRDVLNDELRMNWYQYSSIGTLNSWFDKVRSSTRWEYPAILDIDTRSVAAFPYSSKGHFVNISGYDIYDTHNIFDIRITDPYGPGLGNRWYQASDVYNANNAHWRQAIIW